MSSPCQRHTATMRRALWLSYVGTTVFAAAGFSIIALSLDLVFTSLGTLVVVVTLVGGIISRNGLRAGIEDATLRATLDDMHGRLLRIERATCTNGKHTPPKITQQKAEEAKPNDETVGASAGLADLISARLEGDVYPRLANAEEASDPPGPPITFLAAEHRTPLDALSRSALESQWDKAVLDADLATCQQLQASLAVQDMPGEINARATQLSAIADQIEASLRQAFSQSVRDGDVEAVLAVGERICALLPDRAIAAEFNDLKPLLLARASSAKL